MRRLIIAAGLALGLVAPVRAEPDLSRMSPPQITALTRAMPKGGELHVHLGGAVYAEDMLAWAVEDKGCIDVAALAIRLDCPASPSVKPIADALAADPTLYGAMLDSLSTRHPGFMGRSGHDQFFGAFGRGDYRPERRGDALAAVMDRLAHENAFYLEVMITPQSAQTAAIARSVAWTADLPKLEAAFKAAGLEALAPQASAETDAWEARARQVLGCGAPAAKPGCQVTVRYLFQTNRVLPLQATFAQLQLARAVIARDPRWVGVQIVAPEDAPPARANYAEHMRMMDYISDHGRRLNLALHAGELNAEVAPPQDLRDHVAQAVRVAGARRIGHGVDIPGEDGAEALAQEMAARRVLVEINLSSNDVILGVKGRDHPYAWLRARGVPTALSTDDAAVLRIDLSHEYARAAEEGAGYADLKASARNTLAFSFLAGAGLWLDPGDYRRPDPACAADLAADRPPSAPCTALVRGSDKAREQLRLERAFARFEAER
jgi:adenosine deaminase